MKARRYSIIAALAVFIVTGGGVAAYRVFFAERPGALEDAEIGFPIPVQTTAKSTAHLYFADRTHTHLTAEDRTMALPEGLVERAKSLVRALIEGPRTSLTPTLPKEAKLLALYVTQQGIAYVDFNSAIHDKHPGGSLSELLTIYSVVNTLSLNIPEIEAVKILIEGREAQTLAGHIDLSLPYRPDLLMVK